MLLLVPVFDRSKSFSSYVCYRESRFCISCDDLGDYWVSVFSEGFPSFYNGPYTKFCAYKSLKHTLEYFNQLDQLGGKNI